MVRKFETKFTQKNVWLVAERMKVSNRLSAKNCLLRFLIEGVISLHKPRHMIELEVYAAGVRNLEKILELDHEFEAVPGLRYKVDSNHDIVYLEFDEPTYTIQEIRNLFRKLGLTPRIVGTIPPELNPKNKTQLLRSSA